MVNTIQEALNPLFLVAFFFGIGLFRHPLNYPKVFLSILYVLSVWSIYAYTFYYLNICFPIRRMKFIEYFMVTIHLLVIIISTIFCIHEHKKFSVLINKLRQVDDTLEELGTPKEYHKLRNLIKWMIIMLFMIICITWTTQSLCGLEIFNDKKVFIISFVVGYSFYANILITIMVMVFLRYIGTRYDKINDHIRRLSEAEECGLICICKKSYHVTCYCIRNTHNRKRILWIAMHLHSQLCRIARDINGLFEMQMTLQTISFFVTLTTTFYYQYHIILCSMYNGEAVGLKFFVCSNIWCAFDLIRLIKLNYIYESISAKAQKTEGIIHKLTNFIYFVQARQDICQFLMQIIHRPLKFTGMGLFYFGHKFLCKFFTWVLTVIVIVIQMDTTSISQEYNKETKNNVKCYKF